MIGPFTSWKMFNHIIIKLYLPVFACFIIFHLAIDGRRLIRGDGWNCWCSKRVIIRCSLHRRRISPWWCNWWAGPDTINTAHCNTWHAVILRHEHGHLVTTGHRWVASDAMSLHCHWTLWLVSTQRTMHIHFVVFLLLQPTRKLGEMLIALIIWRYKLT